MDASLTNTVLHDKDSGHNRGTLTTNVSACDLRMPTSYGHLGSHDEGLIACCALYRSFQDSVGLRSGHVKIDKNGLTRPFA